MAYIGSAPTSVVSRQSSKVYRYTATAGQTVFSGADASNQILDVTPSDTKVHINGLLLEPSDYTLTSSSVTLTTAAAAGDELTVTGFQTFEVADTYDKATADTRYVNASGDTMTGGLNVTGGNLLVGTAVTDGGYDDADGGATATFMGASIGGAASGTAFVSRRAAPLQLNRQANDGDIAQFRKDGTTVGSIGSYSGVGMYAMAPNNGGSGLLFYDNAAPIYPIKNVSGSATIGDAYTDLGAAVHRFKDLYLSGGVYLGGTGASNKLDDYEEGTYTPVVDAGTASGTRSYAYQQGVYTKIGRRVFVWFDLNVSSWSGASGVFLLSLPFSSSSTSEMGQFTPWDIHNNYTGGGTPTQWIPQNSSYMYMYTWTLHSATGHNGWNLNTTGRISGSVSYTVD